MEHWHYRQCLYLLHCYTSPFFGFPWIVGSCLDSVSNHGFRFDSSQKFILFIFVILIPNIAFVTH